MFWKFIKFGVVGFSGVFVDFAITYLLKEKVKINRFVANSAGFITAASSNYYLNRIWTFHSHNPQILTEYSMFIAVALVGLVINNFFLYTFEKKFNFYFSKLLAIGITTLWNFAANYLLTFH
ncbi:MAG TPA: glycosyl transferase family 2 [Bacteroidales bacterium]|nr:glycosyl transferase family 2 [Bacteroidales bacterium]